MELTTTEWILFIITSGIIAQSIVELDLTEWKSWGILAVSLITGIIFGFAFEYRDAPNPPAFQHVFCFAFLFGYLGLYAAQADKLILPRLSPKNLLLFNILFLFYYYNSIELFHQLSFFQTHFLQISFIFTLITLLTFFIIFFQSPLTEGSKKFLYLWYLIMSTLLCALIIYNLYKVIPLQTHLSMLVVSNFFITGILLFTFLVNAMNVAMFLRGIRPLGDQSLLEIFASKFDTDVNARDIILTCSIVTLGLLLNTAFLQKDPFLILNIILIILHYFSTIRMKVVKQDSLS